MAQEVFIKVLRGLPADDDGLTLPAWLYRVTVNAAFDHLRRRKRRPVTVAEEAAPESVAAVDEYERAELAQRVETTLGELPKRQQVALVLRDVHGLSVTETASVLGVTRGSADVLLTRARAGFRRVFLAGDYVSGRCGVADGILAGGVGGGVSAADRSRLEEHARTCPDCRRVAGLWSVAPVGLGLLLPQVALPGGLSLSATLAAAQAAGVVLPAGLGAAAGAGAAASAGGSGAAASATGVSAAAGSVAAGSAAAGTAAAGTAATGTGVLAALGSAAGIKIATLAAVAAAGLGDRRRRPRGSSRRPEGRLPVAAGVSAGHAGRAAGGDTGGGRGDRARLLAEAHRGRAPGVRGPAGAGRGASGADARGDGGHATGQSGAAGSGSATGGAGAEASGSGGANGAGGTAASGAGQSGAGSSGSIRLDRLGRDGYRRRGLRRRYDHGRRQWWRWIRRGRFRRLRRRSDLRRLRRAHAQRRARHAGGDGDVSERVAVHVEGEEAGARPLARPDLRPDLQLPAGEVVHAGLQDVRPLVDGGQPGDEPPARPGLEHDDLEQPVVELRHRRDVHAAAERAPVADRDGVRVHRHLAALALRVHVPAGGAARACR